MSDRHQLAFRRLPSGLLVPFVAETNTAGGLPESRFILTTVGFSELFQRSLPIGSVVERLRKYSLQQAVLQLSRITLALTADWMPGTTAAGQRLILTRLLGEEATDRLYARLRQRRGPRY